MTILTVTDGTRTATILPGETAADVIGGWFPDAPAEVLDALADLHPAANDVAGRADYLGLTLVETGDAEVAATAAVLRDAEAAVARARDARNTAIRVAVETRELTAYAAAKAAGISPQAVAQILGR